MSIAVEDKERNEEKEKKTKYFHVKLTTDASFIAHTISNYTVIGHIKFAVHYF